MMQKLQLPLAVRELSGEWLIGLSGGADSIALTRLLLDQCPEAHFTAVHVNHGLRGDESDTDEAFVKAFCAEQGITLRIERLEPPAHPGEAWARDGRYTVFRRIAKELGASGILLAHHRTDQAETLLLHLLRGSGLDGLCGMRADSVSNGLRIIRPLLQFDPEALRDYLRSLRQRWREDSSNQSDAYLRNRIRHELLPLLEALAPGATERLAATTQALQPDADELNRQTAELIQTFPPNALPVAALKQQPEAIVRRLLRSRCAELTDEIPDRERTRAMMKLIHAATGKLVELPGAVSARGHDSLLFRPKQNLDERCVPVETIGRYSHGAIILTVSPGGTDPGDGKTVQEFPAHLLKGCVLRYRRSGDIIHPFGMNGTKRLQDWFVDHKIPAVDRDRIPLLCRGDEVLLVAGFGAGGIPRWSADADNLRFTWSGHQPGLHITD